MNSQSSPRPSGPGHAADMSLGEAERRFVDDLGQMYARYGLAPTFGRVFALLLISDEPLSLDELAAKLGISKTQASVAARDLERLGGARRLSTPGSRRIRYEASENMETIFKVQFERIRDGLDKLQRVEPALSPGRGKNRLRQMKELHEFWLRESEGIMERWRRSRR